MKADCHCRQSFMVMPEPESRGFHPLAAEGLFSL
jgi:hypothetical protein